MSLPMSRSSLTVEVWPFIAANISGEIPSLLPVLEMNRIHVVTRAHRYTIIYMYILYII